MRITGTLWVVVWRYTDDTKPVPDRTVHGKSHVITADPTGRDLFEIAERSVLWPEPGARRAFTIIEAHRCAEVSGTAIAESPARAN